MKNKPFLFITSLVSIVLVVLAVFGALAFLTASVEAADQAQVESRDDTYRHRHG